MSDKHEMVIDYESYYSGDYWNGRRTYLDGNGQVQQYHGPSLEWTGFELVAQALAPLLPGKSLLDIGCSAGHLANEFMKRGYDAYGVDVSKYALDNCVKPMKGRLALDDITTCPSMLEAHDWNPAAIDPLENRKHRFPSQFDVVMATDVLEHLYEEDLDRTFDWMMAKTKRWMFFLVAIVNPKGAQEEFIHKKGEPVPHRWQGVAAAGHVNVRTWQYWVKFFKGKGLTIRWDLTLLFQMAREQIEAWKNTPGWGIGFTWILQRPRAP